LTEEAVDELDENEENAICNPSVDDYFKLVGNKNQKGASDSDNSAKKAKPATPRSLAKVNTKGIKPLTSFFKAK
jgi:hypothetical protein